MAQEYFKNDNFYVTKGKLVTSLSTSLSTQDTVYCVEPLFSKQINIFRLTLKIAKKKVKNDDRKIFFLFFNKGTGDINNSSRSIW